MSFNRKAFLFFYRPLIYFHLSRCVHPSVADIVWRQDRVTVRQNALTLPYETIIYIIKFGKMCKPMTVFVLF